MASQTCCIKPCPFSAALVFVPVDNKLYCEGHYEQQFITPILHEERNCEETLRNLRNARFQHQQNIRVAREMAGIKPILLTCSKCKEFKLASAIGMASHETFCPGPKIKPKTTVRAEAAAERKAKDKEERAVTRRVRLEMTDDDL